MAVRNWWIEADIDGRRTELSGGPRAKTGGFTLRIYQRNCGAIMTAARIEGFAKDNGDLILRIHAPEAEDHPTNVSVMTSR